MPDRSNVRALLDVNVLLAMFDPAHPFQARVRAWWAASKEHGWASCPLTQNGFVRVVSQPSYPARRSIFQGRELLRVAGSQADHEFWPDDISILDEKVFSDQHVQGPRQITDIYLLALAVKNGGRLVTLDTSIPLAAVRGAERRHLVVPE